MEPSPRCIRQDSHGKLKQCIHTDMGKDGVEGAPLLHTSCSEMREIRRKEQKQEGFSDLP